MTSDSRLNVLLVGASGELGTGILNLMAQSDKYMVIPHYNCNVIRGYRAFRADITKFTEVCNMVDLVLHEFGRIDALINLSGLSINGMAHKFSDTDWQRELDVNLTGAFHLARAVLPHMREQGFGRIINLASVVYQKPVAGTVGYSASKAGLVGLTRTIALENANKGITCNCIALGYFDGGMFRALPPNTQSEIIQSIPMHRAGRVDELYATIEYLLETEYITGQTLSVNGGLAFE